MDPALLSAASALLGALIGGSASLAAAIYTQRYQDRLQRVVRETTKREVVYADFVMAASKLVLDPYVSEGFALKGDEQRLIGLANRMSLFAHRTSSMKRSESSGDLWRFRFNLAWIFKG